MKKREKIYIFRENGVLYVAKEGVYLNYIRLKSCRVKCTGFKTADEVIKYLCEGSKETTVDDFVIVV